MENINELSDKDWKKLCLEIKPLSYIEKVRILYDRFGLIWGKDKRIINKKEHEISLTPETPEENLQRWEYYVEQKAQDYCRKWTDSKLKNLDKVADKGKAITQLREGLIKEVKGNYKFEQGYNSGITQTGLDWINGGAITNDLRPQLNDWAKGLGLYYAEGRLNEIKGKTAEDDDILNVEGDFSIGYRLVLAEQVGILEHLMRKYKIPINQPTKLAKLLGEIMGIDISSEKNKLFIPYVKNILADNQKAGPKNPTSLSEVNGFLTKLRLK